MVFNKLKSTWYFSYKGKSIHEYASWDEDKGSEKQEEKTGKTTAFKFPFQHITDLEHDESPAFPMHFSAMENVPCHKPQIWFNVVLTEDKYRRVSLCYSLHNEKCPILKQIHSAQSSQVSAAIQLSRYSLKNPEESVIMVYLQRHHRNSHLLETIKENKHMFIHIWTYLHMPLSPT